MMFYDWAAWAAEKMKDAKVPAALILEIIKSAEEMAEEEKDYQRDLDRDSPRDYGCYDCDHD